MSNVISKDNLRAGLNGSKNFTNAKVLELTNTLIRDLEGLADLAAILYVDEDGYVCQRDDSEVEEEEADNGDNG